MHNKIKFRLNKYSINIIVVYAVLLFLIKSILKLISYFVAFNMVKVGACILVPLLALLFLAYKIITEDEDFKKMNFSEDVVNSLTSHMKYVDKFYIYMEDKVMFFQKQCTYTFSTKNILFDIERLYKYELPYIKEGNEFWINANALYLSLMTNNSHHPELKKIRHFVDLEENLYNHRNLVLKHIKCVFQDKDNCYKLKNDGRANSYIVENINLMANAVTLNNLIYTMDDYTPHKKMLTTLFDNWVVLVVNYIIDTDDCLNKQLINSFKDISLMVTKTITEINTQKQEIQREEQQKIRNIWDEKSEEYAKLVNSIAKDLK